MRCRPRIDGCRECNETAATRFLFRLVGVDTSMLAPVDNFGVDRMAIGRRYVLEISSTCPRSCMKFAPMPSF